MNTSRKGPSTADEILAHHIGESFEARGTDVDKRPYMEHMRFFITISDSDLATVVYEMSLHKPCWSSAVDIDTYSWTLIDAVRAVPGVYDINRYAEHEYVQIEFAFDFQATTMRDLLGQLEGKVVAIMDPVEAGISAANTQDTGSSNSDH